MHYRQHMKYASAAGGALHYLVIGPWDHAGTRTPQTEFVGVKVGPASLVDLPRLHHEWYAWTLQGGPKPGFLQKNVAYYVMGAEEWRYADTLEEVTARSDSLYLHSTANPTDVFHSGILTGKLPDDEPRDHYTYDPRDVSLAALESTVDPESRTDMRMVYASAGKHLVYHSAPLSRTVEIAGFFRLSLWLAIDQPDTDFRVSIYEVDIDGSAILLSSDWIRARYRESLREARLVDTTGPLRYDFERFTFVARRMKPGSRLRLIVGPLHSIFSQKNYNSGREVSRESLQDACVVRVTLLHDRTHPSALHVPLANGSDGF